MWSLKPVHTGDYSRRKVADFGDSVDKASDVRDRGATHPTMTL